MLHSEQERADIGCSPRKNTVAKPGGTLYHQLARRTAARLPCEGAAKTRLTVTSPKTARGQQTVPLPAAAAEELRRFAVGQDGDAYVLTGKRERMMDPRTYRDGVYDAHAVEANNTTGKSRIEGMSSKTFWAVELNNSGRIQEAPRNALAQVFPNGLQGVTVEEGARRTSTELAGCIVNAATKFFFINDKEETLQQVEEEPWTQIEVGDVLYATVDDDDSSAVQGGNTLKLVSVKKAAVTTTVTNIAGVSTATSAQNDTTIIKTALGGGTTTHSSGAGDKVSVTSPTGTVYWDNGGNSYDILSGDSMKINGDLSIANGDTINVAGELVVTGDVESTSGTGTIVQSAGGTVTINGTTVTVDGTSLYVGGSTATINATSGLTITGTGQVAKPTSTSNNTPDGTDGALTVTDATTAAYNAGVTVGYGGTLKDSLTDERSASSPIKGTLYLAGDLSKRYIDGTNDLLWYVQVIDGDALTVKNFDTYIYNLIVPASSTVNIEQTGTATTRQLTVTNLTLNNGAEITGLIYDGDVNGDDTDLPLTIATSGSVTLPASATAYISCDVMFYDAGKVLNGTGTALLTIPDTSTLYVYGWLAANNSKNTGLGFQDVARAVTVGTNTSVANAVSGVASARTST